MDVKIQAWGSDLTVNFGPFIAYTNIDTESLNILREYINDIMK